MPWNCLSWAVEQASLSSVTRCCDLGSSDLQLHINIPEASPLV
jgi:hypothetical protein